MEQVVGTTMPAELRTLDQWLLWRLDERGGRPTKVPYDPRTGRLASSTDPHTWTSYAEALAEVGGYSGLGFVFTPDDPYCGIDFDHCYHDGVLDPTIARWVGLLDSYTERSPSGDGLHVIVRARLAGARQGKWGGVYDRARYFTMSGQTLPAWHAGAAIPDRQAVVESLLAALCPPPRTVARPPSPGAPRLPDAEIVARAMRARNGEKFRALHEGGRLHYPSESEADLAYLDMLAFWTRDPAQLERVFWASPRMRPKWEQRADYRERTIARALTGTSAQYLGPDRGNPPVWLKYSA